MNKKVLVVGKLIGTGIAQEKIVPVNVFVYEEIQIPFFLIKIQDDKRMAKWGHR